MNLSRFSTHAAALSFLVFISAPASKRIVGSLNQDRAKSTTAAKQTSSAQSRPARAPIDWSKVADALGKPGALQPGDVYKVGIPRGDLRVAVSGVPVMPALALGSWVAFRQTGENEATAMGDLVLLDSEVGPVTEKLQEGVLNRQRSTITCSMNRHASSICTSELTVIPSGSPPRSTPPCC